MPVTIPETTILEERIGDPNDSIEVHLGPNRVRIFEDYDVQMSVMQQPAAFSLAIGWGGSVRDLLDIAAPGTPFDLRVSGVVVQSGRVDERQVSGSAAGSTVQIRGRDWMAPLYDSYVEAERSFSETTYYQLTRKVLDLVGLTEPEHGLITSDGEASAAFKKAITGTQTIKVVNEQTVEKIQAGDDPKGDSKVVNKRITAKLGERWYDFLQRQYKLAGLFLWCTGEGHFVLGPPYFNQAPAFSIVRNKSGKSEIGNVLSYSFKDSTTSRHSEVRVYGRSGGGPKGRTPVAGIYSDPELAARDIRKIRTERDDECKSVQDAEFVARRLASEERRAGWSLQYTLSGHTYPSGGIYSFDTMCKVKDDELGIEGDLYVESVSYSRKPETTTTITLMRPEDMLFAKPEMLNRAPKLRKHPKG